MICAKTTTGFPRGQKHFRFRKGDQKQFRSPGRGRESVWVCCQPSDIASEAGRDEGDSNELEKRPLPKWIENERLI